MHSYDYSQIDPMKWNQTYASKMHKYTLNLPKEVFVRAQARAKAAGIYRVSIYFRAIIERELNSEGTVKIDDLLDAKNLVERYERSDKRKEANRLYVESPHKEVSWVRLNLRRAMKIFQPKQHIFDFKNKV